MSRRAINCKGSSCTALSERKDAQEAAAAARHVQRNHGGPGTVLGRQGARKGVAVESPARSEGD